MSCSEWKRVKLKDLCLKIGSGATPRGGASVYKETGITFIRSQNVYNNEFDYEGLVYIDDNAALKLKNVELKENDVLLNITGDSVARCTIVPKNLLPARVNQHVCILRADEEKVIPFFLKSYLVSSSMQKIMLSLAQSGGTRAALTKGMIENLEIELPPLEEQEKIVEVLSSLDYKIELNNEMNKNLDEMAQSIFKRWFVDFEFPNEDGQPYKSSGGEMVESELGMIPKGWEVNKLGKLVNLITKSEKPFNNEDILYEHFSIPAFDNNKLPIFENGKDISSNKYKIDSDCILMSKLNPDNKRIWNPYCTTDKSICSTEFMVYKPINKNQKSFIYEILNDKRFTEFLISNATGSTGSRQRVKPKDTLEYYIVIPKKNSIKDFINVISPIHYKMQLNIQNIKELNKLRDILLPRLMSGYIR